MAGNEGGPARWKGVTSNGSLGSEEERRLRQLQRAYGIQPTYNGNEEEAGRRSQARSAARRQKVANPRLQETYPGSGVWRLVK